MSIPWVGFCRTAHTQLAKHLLRFFDDVGPTFGEHFTPQILHHCCSCQMIAVDNLIISFPAGKACLPPNGRGKTPRPAPAKPASCTICGKDTEGLSYLGLLASFSGQKGCLGFVGARRHCLKILRWRRDRAFHAVWPFWRLLLI